MAISLSKNQANTIFWAFIISHVVFWTLAPMLIRFNLPMDSIEGAIWSQKLVFGYDKAPLLNAWITAGAIWLFGYVDWAIYLTSQLSVAVCFIALWLLAKKNLSPIYALLSIIILEGFQYYHIGAIDFDDNVLQLPLWALSCLFFYKALNEKKLSDWVWLGIFTGLALLAKYYAILLFLSMLAFLGRLENRYCFSERGIYLAFAIFLVIISPHVFWLFHHDFLTIHYVFRRIGDLPTWSSHVINPLLFLRDEAYALIVPGLLFVLLFFGSERGENDGLTEKSLVKAYLKPTSRSNNSKNVSDQKFLIYLSLVPLLLAVLISILTGIKLHIMWGSALFSLWGMLFFSFFQPTLNDRKIYRFFIVMLLLFFMTLIGYLLSIRWSKNNSSAHFPGRPIAHNLIESWYQRYHQPLAYVIGNRWLAGNLSFYSHLHPIVLIDGDLRLAPWLDPPDLNRKGALLIWDVNQFGSTIPAQYRHFLLKKILGLMTFLLCWSKNLDFLCFAAHIFLHMLRCDARKSRFFAAA